jgi:predicted PurR-regulated permease PerM
MKDETTTGSWPEAWRSPLRFAGVFFGVGCLLLFLWTSRSIFVATFLGLLFGVSIMPAVAWLHRFRVPRALAAAILVVACFAVLAGVGLLLAPVIHEQAAELQQRLPEAIDRIDRELLRRHILANAIDGGRAMTASPLRAILGQQFGSIAAYLFPVFSTTLAAVSGLILVVFLAIFFAADPETYMRGALQLVPRAQRARATEVLKTMGHALRAWLMARSIAMVTIGVVVTAAMALLGVRAAIALGVIAGLLELVPVFGPIIGAIPAIALGFLDSPQKAFAVLIAFIIIQQLEGNVLIPLLLQKAVQVPPALTLIGIGALAVVLGIVGVLIAEPLVAVALVAVKMLYVEPNAHRRAAEE